MTGFEVGPFGDSSYHSAKNYFQFLDIFPFIFLALIKQILYNIIVIRYPSSVNWQDSNLQPFYHESSPMTTN